MRKLVEPLARLLVFVSIIGAPLERSAAQDRELDRAEESHRYGRAYQTGDLHLPGAKDPFDHFAGMDIGVYRHSEAGATTLYLPMRFTVNTRIGNHWQIYGRFPLAGAVSDTSGAPRERTFRPGNVALGSYYTMGDDDHGTMWTIGAGGQLSLPTAQDDSISTAEFDARFGSASVHGLEDLWNFSPNTFGIVPGGYARFATGPFFANAKVDFDINIATNGGTRAHALQLRLEAGYRGSETLRVGLGYTNVLLVGGTGTGDRSQSALRVFLRADIKLLTVGCELVMNLDDTLGFAFSDGGIWGVVSTVGLSL